VEFLNFRESGEIQIHGMGEFSGATAVMLCISPTEIWALEGVRELGI
jgi:hypothetical protein